MANCLKRVQIQAIEVLWDRDCSYRRIARELGIHRETVARYVQLVQAASANADPTLNSGDDGTNLPTGLTDQTAFSVPRSGFFRRGRTPGLNP